MQKMSDSDYKLFKTLASMGQKALLKCMKQYLESKYDDVVATADYVYAIGDIPIALAAHLDTVFPTPPQNIYYDKEQGVLWSPEGLGADDRAGVFAILKIIQAGLRPTIIFTTDEEKGCLGAEKLVIDHNEPITDLRYIIQLDRRGICDCVFYDCDNRKFVQYVENFGFIEALGSFTDISYLCPVWGVAGVNLSVGYENEHNLIETLSVAPLYKTINNVKKMLKETNIPSFEYIPSKTSYSWYSSFSKNKNSFLSGLWLDDDDDDEYPCAACGTICSEYSLIPTHTKNGETKYYCGDCCISLVEWCDECGEAYEKDANPKLLCYKCRKTNNKKSKKDHNNNAV